MVTINRLCMICLQIIWWAVTDIFTMQAVSCSVVSTIRGINFLYTVLAHMYGTGGQWSLVKLVKNMTRTYDLLHDT